MIRASGSLIKNILKKKNFTTVTSSKGFGISKQQFNNVKLFSTTNISLHGSGKPPEGEGITINFITPEGETVSARGRVGQSILDVAHSNEIDLEGACEASLACSTCHVILTDEIFDSLEEPTDEENDMLDLAFGLTETSRLGCQVELREDMEGMTVKIPSATRNMAVDGFKPKPH
ncbi:ferredoxin precursor [Conidiobolus coronatus NRRL 28638]|uniref:Ferredoxin n=1 Tax=Conidiobolus coronatus (strain ATCC 28846 / CBS 209.66 / NRRL 28638) TaxID=796925 RepID=A0A137P7Z6_CONC2|nr:ferredoxin precursor [Conidiobolus coronatus NRRL 28638]|eukprot:KXN71099.1 ferredoxin precursor [Conidiobolus coronatus NRRL 28638]